MAPQPSVLVVDPSEETREVLCSALARRGVRTFAAARATDGLALAAEVRPDVIVLDVDQRTPTTDEDFPGRFAAHTPGAARSLVLLGRMTRPKSAAVEGHEVAKPYHYAPLIRKIEQLLAAS